MSQKSEFTVQGAYRYDQRSTFRWLVSHVWRYRYLFLLAVALNFIGWSSFSYARILIGHAAEEIMAPTVAGALGTIALTIMLLLVMDGIVFLIASLSIETIAQRLERDAREELYVSLLGKSQTFHDRQRVGDIMSRATDDVQQMNVMINPGVPFIFESLNGFLIPMIFIGTIHPELLLWPIVFVIGYIITVRLYVKQMLPVLRIQREKSGGLSAGLEESISGIEIVKASAQEIFERTKFRRNAAAYRDYFIKQGQTEARYLPILIYAFIFGIGFLQSLALYEQGSISVADIVGYVGLMILLRFPAFISVFSVSMLQAGYAGAERVLHIIKAETELDENVGGYSQPIKGEIVFEDVSFGYEDGTVLEGISFHVRPGETVAIVGQTGSGKSTLTELVNRTYDVTKGRILIDGVDVREWNLTSLRSQISKIEQDVFLFSRSVADNIAFGAPDTPQERIEQAAKEAQAHDFIMTFKEGYQAEVGERGVTLSGGQRQRIALARAFLSNPRILILDDSTSAIDSATEDEIQKAIWRAQEGRTTLLITHRLSQIRWADHIVVVDRGKLVAAGKHEELLQSSPHYRRIFARYDMALPPLQTEPQAV